VSSETTPKDPVKTFWNRLHNQIVLPLVGATAVVGVVATLMGIVLISDIVERWVDANAQGRVESLEAHFSGSAESLISSARLVSEDPRLADAISQGARQDMTAFLIELMAAVEIDNVMVLDPDGSVVAGVGELDVAPGDVPLPEDAARWGRLGMAYATQAPIAGVRTLTAIHPVEAQDGYRLAASFVVDDAFLARAAAPATDVYCYSDESGACFATTAGLPSSDVDLWAEDWLGVAENTDALQSDTARTFSIELDGRPFRVQTKPFMIDGDPTEAKAYLIGVVDGTVAAETQATTIRLILFWSTLALVALWAMGLIVARRVSQPIVRLTESARHVAEGDYSFKVPAEGSNELALLAVTFNEMTDSLRERNESLTKKVLELATLYEMSRLLGGTLELETLLDSVLDSALRIFDVEAGYVILREREHGGLRLVAWRGPDIEDATDTELRSSISEWVVREGRPLIFNPTRGGEHEPVRVDSVTGATTALSVPLISNEGPVGAITVGSKDRTVRFDSDDVRLLSTVANHATIAIGNIELFSSLQEAYLATVRSLAAAVDAKDSYTRGHSDRVAVFAMAIAEAMDLSADQLRTLEMAAYLHDIGKIGVRESILLKPGKLDADEMSQMRHHPLIGASILKPVVFPWPVAPIIRHHHERWDGTGYPAGLRGEEIPLLARILTVADAYEAMTADRPYRMGRGKQDAIAELQRCSGSQFDAKVVEAFVGALEGLEPSDERRELLGSEVQRDEARAVFAAICDGMFASFRRLGGPRLASNVEADLNQLFEEEELPASYANGRVFFRWDDTESFDDELEDLRSIVGLISETMGQYSGTTLVDHFYAEALSALSGRLRMAAATLEFRPKV
jgi:putative nucleotidyltransferase with HDIG domain